MEGHLCDTAPNRSEARSQRLAGCPQSGADLVHIWRGTGRLGSSSPWQPAPLADTMHSSLPSIHSSLSRQLALQAELNTQLVSAGSFSGLHPSFDDLFCLMLIDFATLCNAYLGVGPEGGLDYSKFVAIACFLCRLPRLLLSGPHKADLQPRAHR